jgi:soluble lytic murein transglycosylase-like protein
VLVLIAFILQTIIEQTGLPPVTISQMTPVSSPTRIYRPPTPTPNIPPTATPALTYEEIFQKIALQYGLDWRILAALAYQESRMNPLAMGRDNDMGLMQILPSTWNEWAPKVGVSDPFDPYSNALVAAAYLAYLRDYCRVRGYGEMHWMLIGYNWGPQNLRQLFESKGGLAEVPEKQRQYASVIMEATSGVAVYWEKSAKKPIDSSLNY